MNRENVLRFVARQPVRMMMTNCTLGGAVLATGCTPSLHVNISTTTRTMTMKLQWRMCFDMESLNMWSQIQKDGGQTVSISGLSKIVRSGKVLKLICEKLVCQREK